MTGQFFSASGEPAVGTQIAGYRLEEQIGRGGMAVVYRARDVRLDRWVALKIMSPEAARDVAFRQRFIHESRAAAAVDHPHIIPIFEAGEASGVLFIAMRYVAGGDVRALVSRLGRLPVGRTANIVTQVASALDAAHANGLVHRDVKPGNMLMGVVAAGGYADHVYLSDFGLSKQSLSTAALTAAGQFLGTLDYIAPEQIEGRPVDGRADLYGLACAAFEMLSGAPPFRRDENLALMWAQLSEPPPRLTSRRAGLPAPVDHVLARAMAKSPDERYPTCLDFAAALRAACGPGGAAAKPPPAPPRPVTELARPVQPGPGLTAQDRPASHGWQAAVAGGGHGPRPQARPRPATPESGRRYPGRPDQASQEPIRPEHGRPDQARPGQGRPRPARPDLARQDLAGGRPARPGQGRRDQARPDQGRPDHGWPDHGRPDQLRTGGTKPARRPGTRPRQRSGVLLAIAGVITGVIVVAVAVGAFTLFRPHSGAGLTPGQGGGPSSSATPGVLAGPAATVRAYFAAISDHDYARAWRLGGRNASSSYSAYVRGYDGTARDKVTILSVAGDVVTARISAVQTDGAVRRFQGTYTVRGGVIVRFNVHHVF